MGRAFHAGQQNARDLLYGVSPSPSLEFFFHPAQRGADRFDPRPGIGPCAAEFLSHLFLRLVLKNQLEQLALPRLQASPGFFRAQWRRPRRSRRPPTCLPCPEAPLPRPPSVLGCQQRTASGDGWSFSACPLSRSPWISAGIRRAKPVCLMAYDTGVCVFDQIAFVKPDRHIDPSFSFCLRPGRDFLSSSRVLYSRRLWFVSKAGMLLHPARGIAAAKFQCATSCQTFSFSEDYVPRPAAPLIILVDLRSPSCYTLLDYRPTNPNLPA